MSDLVCPRLTPLEILSRNLRFPKAEDAKPMKTRYVFVALEFRHLNLEMLLRVMLKLGSYGRLSGSVFFVLWSECATFTSHILIQERSWLIIHPRESHAIFARSVRLNAHEESKGGRKNKTSDGRRHLDFCAHFSLGNLCLQRTRLLWPAPKRVKK